MRCLAPDQHQHYVSTSLRGGKVTIISESGLYKLVMRSDKPQAKQFQDWVTREVLPAIRKDGAYIMGEEKVRSGELSKDELDDLISPVYLVTPPRKLTVFYPRKECLGYPCTTPTVKGRKSRCLFSKIKQVLLKPSVRTALNALAAQSMRSSSVQLSIAPCIHSVLVVIHLLLANYLRNKERQMLRGYVSTTRSPAHEKLSFFSVK